jgi:hypothetical protein
MLLEGLSYRKQRFSNLKKRKERGAFWKALLDGRRNIRCRRVSQSRG